MMRPVIQSDSSRAAMSRLGGALLWGAATIAVPLSAHAQQGIQQADHALQYDQMLEELKAATRDNGLSLRPEAEIIKRQQGIRGKEFDEFIRTLEKFKVPPICPEGYHFDFRTEACGPPAVGIPRTLPPSSGIVPPLPDIVPDLRGPLNRGVVIRGSVVQSDAAGTSSVPANASHLFDWRTFATTVALAGPDGIPFCTGVLIGKRSILTAAHCTCDRLTITKAFFGNSTLPSDGQTTRFSLPVTGQAVLYDKAYCQKRAMHLANNGKPRPPIDLALLMLGATIAPKDRHKFFPVEHLWNEESFLNSRVVGFGFSNQSNATGRKNYAEQWLLPDDCEIMAYECSKGEEIVARPLGGTGSADSCSGDSGGPLFVVHEERHYLAGIVSRGLPNNPAGLCGKGGVYVDMRNPDVRAWLQPFIKKEEI